MPTLRKMVRVEEKTAEDLTTAAYQNTTLRLRSRSHVHSTLALDISLSYIVTNATPRGHIPLKPSATLGSHTV